MTVREWAERWQEKYDAPAVRRTSYEAHRYVLGNHIIPSLGECELTELTAGMVGEFLTERRAHGNRRNSGPLSEVTMGHIWRLLTCILDRAVEEGQMEVDPARAFHYGTERQVKAVVLTNQEIEAYLDAAGELGYLPIFLLALEQGLRQRELIALKWSDLDVKTRTLTIHEGRVVECGKLVEHGGKMRMIGLPRFTAEQLIREHEKHPSSEAMFIHPGTLKPYSPGMIRLLHKRVLEQAGLEHISFKNLRHTCVVRALENKQNVKTLSAMLGHTRASVTRQGYQAYLPQTKQEKAMYGPCDPAETQMRQAADKLGEVFAISI